MKRGDTSHKLRCMYEGKACYFVARNGNRQTWGAVDLLLLSHRNVQRRQRETNQSASRTIFRMASHCRGMYEYLWGNDFMNECVECSTSIASWQSYRQRPWLSFFKKKHDSLTSWHCTRMNHDYDMQNKSSAATMSRLRCTECNMNQFSQIFYYRN